MPNETLSEAGMIVFRDYVHKSNQNAAHRLAKDAAEIAEENRQLKQRSDNQCDQIKQLEALLVKAHSRIGVYEQQESDRRVYFLVSLYFIVTFVVFFFIVR